jgi:hypothetical protein
MASGHRRQLDLAILAVLILSDLEHLFSLRS